MKNKIKFPIGVLYEDMIASLKACSLANKIILSNMDIAVIVNKVILVVDILCNKEMYLLY